VNDHPGPSSAPRENRSVRKAAALLRAAADSGLGASVSALARAAGLPRATALRMIESLIAEELLARLPDDRVVIGPGIYRLARTAHLYELLIDASRGVLEELARSVAESATLTVVMPDGSLSVVRQVDGPHMLGLTNWVGRAVVLHASSSGKLALAHAEPARLEALLRTPLDQVAPRTITDPGALRRELATVRRNGWSEIQDEIEDGLSAISVGIWLNDVLVGSVNVSGPTARFTEAARARALPAVRQACCAIEVRLPR
jgi:DNA-binding IclR family transcriptional regulator